MIVEINIKTHGSYLQKRFFKNFFLRGTLAHQSVNSPL